MFYMGNTRGKRDMKKKKFILISIVLLASMGVLCTINALAEPIRGDAHYKISTAEKGVGPAPNSGDGVPDGSGFDQPHRQNIDSSGKGQAPNSGDGVPDGSGF